MPIIYNAWKLLQLGDSDDTERDFHFSFWVKGKGDDVNSCKKSDFLEVALFKESEDDDDVIFKQYMNRDELLEFIKFLNSALDKMD